MGSQIASHCTNKMNDRTCFQRRYLASSAGTSADRLSEKSEIGYHVKIRSGVYDDHDVPRFDGELMATKDDAAKSTTIDLSDDNVVYLLSVLRDPSRPQPVTTQQLIDALRSRSAI